MAEASNIGANFSSYEGNAGLGGFGLTTGRVDTRPIEDLAKYTMLYNREEYLRLQKAKEKAALELADFTGLDLSTTIPKDAKILQQKFDDLTNYIRQNPGALDYNNRDLWIEYNKKKADLKNDIKFAKIRSIANVDRKDKISVETNEERKKFLESELQKNINDTDIRTPLDWAQKYDIAEPVIDENKGVAIDVTKVGSNQIFQRGFKIYDIKEGDRAGALYEMGLAGIDPKSTGGKLTQMGVDQNPWIQMSRRLNEAIAGAVDPTTKKVDITRLSGVPGIENIKAYNDYVKRMRASITGGMFTDKFGNNIKFMNIPFAADDYKEINLDDGISAAELGKVANFSKWGGDSYDTKVIETDIALKERGLQLEAGRLALGQREFDLKKDQYTSALKAAEVDKNAAVVFAQNLFNDLKGIASRETDDGGFFLTPTDVRKLTTEQLKYLGLETPAERDENGKIIKSEGLSPLKLNSDEVISVAPDGTLRVMKDAKYNDKLDEWVGQWDNTRSTSIWNAATNRLNEENTRSAGRERNAYIPIDLRGKEGVINFDVKGGETKTTGSTTEKASTQLSEKPSDWKKEGNNWRYIPDGRLFDSKGNVIKK